MEDILFPKPDWVDPVPYGDHRCQKCSYRTNDRKHLKEHRQCFHPKEVSYILYTAAEGSLDGRNAIVDHVSNQEIDCTGGQAAFEDGDLESFGQELIQASRATGYRLYHAYRMYDPGLGLCFGTWWIRAGIEAGVFEEFGLPDDVRVPTDDPSESDSETQSSE